MARLVVGLWLGLGLTTLFADWPQFLGPDRNGVSRDSVALATALPEGGLTRLWTYPVGDGFAGPVVVGKRCLIFHRVGDEAVLDALDAVTGEPLWRFAYPTAYVDGFGFDPGPRSVPTVVGERVYLYGAEGMVHAVHLQSGKVLWKRDLTKDLGSPSGFFGRCSSPLVMGEVVMLASGGQVDGKSVTVIGLDVRSGETRWTAGDGEADYASPVRFAPEGISPVALFFVREGVLGIDPQTGVTRFSESFRSPIHASVNAASPVVSGNQFFLSSCYEVGCGLWEWEQRQVKARYHENGVMDCHFATPVLWKGYLYGFHGRQERGTEWRCVRFADAHQQWSTPLPAGSVILADAKLLVLTERGELLVGEASPESWQVHYRAQLTGNEARALPAFADGRFYARDKRRLHAVDLSKR